MLKYLVFAVVAIVAQITVAQAQDTATSTFDGPSENWREELNFQPSAGPAGRSPMMSPGAHAMGPGGNAMAPMSPALGFSCNPLFCACRGDADCNDMFTTPICGARAICIDDVCYCIRN